jgi:flagellar motor switch protein FliN/FliY
MNQQKKKVNDTEYQVAFNRIKNELNDYLDIPIKLHVLIGKRGITVKELIELRPGAIIDLKRSAGESLLLFLNNTFFARGEVTVIEDTFGVRITSINDPRKVGGGK